MAGHKSTVVADATQLEKVLSAGKYDIVLADLDDAKNIAETLGTQGSKPTILPVVYNASPEALSAARSQYSKALKTPARTGQLLAAIDDVMAARARSDKKGASASKGMTP